MGDDSKEMQGVGLIGLVDQNLAVELLSLSESACLMVLHGGLKQLVEVSGDIQHGLFPQGVATSVAMVGLMVNGVEYPVRCSFSGGWCARTP